MNVTKGRYYLYLFLFQKDFAKQSEVVFMHAITWHCLRLLDQVDENSFCMTLHAILGVPAMMTAFCCRQLCQNKGKVSSEWQPLYQEIHAPPQLF